MRLVTVDLSSRYANVCMGSNNMMKIVKKNTHTKVQIRFEINQIQIRTRRKPGFRSDKIEEEKNGSLNHIKF